FFQAEDDIRDFHVTGVQTCALPISKSSAINNDAVALEAGRKRGSIKKSRHAALIEAIEQTAQKIGQNVISPTQQVAHAKSKTKRSEERRVGKKWKIRRRHIN